MDYHGVPIPHIHFIRVTARKVVRYLKEEYENFLFSPNHHHLPASQIFRGSGDVKSTETFERFHNIEANRIWIHNDTLGQVCEMLGLNLGIVSLLLDLQKQYASISGKIDQDSRSSS